MRQLHTDVCTDHFGKWDLIESLFQEKGPGLYPDLSGNVQALETVLEGGNLGLRREKSSSSMADYKA